MPLLGGERTLLVFCGEQRDDQVRQHDADLDEGYRESCEVEGWLKAPPSAQNAHEKRNLQDRLKRQQYEGKTRLLSMRLPVACGFASDVEDLYP